MKAKRTLFLSCFAAVAVASLASAAPPSPQLHSASVRTAPTIARSAPIMTRGATATTNHWNSNSHHRRIREVIFVNAFNPFFFYPYPYYYPYYGYYGYPYDYSYSPYDYGYYSYGAPSYSASIIVQVQTRLARAGYYHGRIDGVMGPRTREAIRAYESAHGLRGDGVISNQLLGTMGIRRY